jgi:hypothetical protein
MFSPYQLSSDGKNYPPEGAAFNRASAASARGQVLATIGLIAPDLSRETVDFHASATIACG